MITRRRVLAASALAPWTFWAKSAGALADDGDLVRLLVDTPRESLLDSLSTRIQAGLTPRQLLAALAVATCREVSPYPNVGFKYHAVMMLRSVEQSMVAMSKERAWLPLLWTADYFKAASAQQDRIEPWSLRPLLEGPRSAGMSEPAALVDALVSWDDERADRSTAAMVAAGQTRAALQTLMLHAARDFRAIGHKPIAAANAHRLVSALGEPVAAPLARSLALAVQNAEGDANPAQHAHTADHDWQANQAMAAKLPPDWQGGRDDISAARTMLEELRTANSADAAGAAAQLLADNVSAHTVWETVMMFAAELILRRNNIVALHASTAANAMHYCYLVADEDRARRLQLLQAVSFMARFRSMVDRDSRTRDRRIDAIEALQAADLDEIFQTLACDRQGVTVDYGMEYRFAAGFGLDAVVAASYDRHSQPAEYLDSGGGSHFYNVGAPATAFGFGVSKEFGGVEATDETEGRDGLRITVALNLLPDDYGDWTASLSYDLDALGGRFTVNASTLAGNRNQASVVYRRDIFHVGVSRETGRNFVPVPLTQAGGAHVLAAGPADESDRLFAGFTWRL